MRSTSGQQEAYLRHHQVRRRIQEGRCGQEVWPQRTVAGVSPNNWGVVVVVTVAIIRSLALCCWFVLRIHIQARIVHSSRRYRYPGEGFTLPQFPSGHVERQRKVRQPLRILAETEPHYYSFLPGELFFFFICCKKYIEQNILYFTFYALTAQQISQQRVTKW